MEGEKKRRWFWGLILLSALLAYPISVGPMERLHIKGCFATVVDDFFGSVYAPLAYIVQRLPAWASDPYMWWIRWWVEG